MELTSEQLEIVNSIGNIKINAVAGSGKTTTLVEYAKAKTNNKKKNTHTYKKRRKNILYIAFNKSAQIEARKKFKNLPNVEVKTAHSLAYKHIFLLKKIFSKDDLRPKDYYAHEIADILKITDTKKMIPYILASHINKLIRFYCNNSKEKIEDVIDDYINTLSNHKSIQFSKKTMMKLNIKQEFCFQKWIKIK